MAKRQQKIAPAHSAHALADKVAEAWYGSGRPGDDAVCLGVVAALCLLIHPDYIGPETEAANALILSATDDEIANLLSQAWATFWLTRPELAFRCECFANWLDEEPRDETTVHAAAAVARAAVKAGLWTGKLADEDVLGTLWTTGMRTNKARQARGEFYTPIHLTRMMAGMALADAEPGMSICDPCCGTGGMFLGAAMALREQGKDPAEFVWFGNDISYVSVAGAAVNAYVWGLGPNVVLGVGDSLAEPDCHTRHIHEQIAVLEHHRGVVGAAKMLALIRDTGERVAQVSDEQDNEGREVA